MVRLKDVRVGVGLLLPQPIGLLFLFGLDKPSPYLSNAKIAQLIISSLLLVITSINSLIEGGNDGYGMHVASLFVMVSLITIIYGRALQEIDLPKSIRIFGVMHFLLVISEFLIPQSREIISHISKLDPSLKLDVNYRSSGFFDGFDIAGIMFGICALNEVICFGRARQKALSLSIYIAIFMLGTILTARTGMLLAIFAFILVSLRNMWAFICLVIYVACLLLIFGGQIIENQTILFMFDFIANYMNGDGFGNSSSRELFREHWFVPKLTLFGNGERPWSGAVETDVGYIQIMSIFGIFGTALIILYYAITACTVYKNKKNLFWIVPTMLFVNIKGSYFWSIPIMMLLAIASEKK